MSFWNGTRWVPDRPVQHQPHRAKRAADWIATLLMIGLVPALLIVMASATLGAKPGSDAAGRQEYTLNYGGFRVWGEPYAYADFSVTRSKADNTDVWVKARCVDSTGAQAIPGADPYGYVWWDPANPTVGWATLDSVKNGTTCEVWLTRSFTDASANPGWPETYLNVSW